MRRILLVEDDETSRDMLKMRLALKGFDVVTAATGMEALHQVALQRPEAILMDMNLPEIDGWEATTRLKADPATATIPVIGVSANAMAGDRDRALKAGCDEYESKPVDIKRLVEKIERLMGETE